MMAIRYNIAYILGIIIALILGGCSTVNNKELVQHQLIDRAIIFDNPEIAGADLSPDGQYITFLKEYQGILNIWVKKVDEPFEKARVLTDSKRPLAGYFWTEDGKYILYVKDNDGDENFNLYMVDPHLGSQDKLPPSKNLTPFKAVRVVLYHLSQNNPDLIWVGINDRDPAWHDLYKLSISKGKLEKLYENKDRITSFEFDWDDNLRILERTDEKGNSEFFKFGQNKQLSKIFDVSVSESASIAGWTKDNRSPYLITNKGDLDLATLFLFDMDSHKLEKIESDPKNRVDIEGVTFNHKTREMIATSYTDDKVEHYWKDKERQSQYEYLKKQFPDRQIGLSASDRDYNKFLVVVSGDKYAAETYLFQPHAEKAEEKLIYQYTSRPALKKVEAQLSPMKAIRYQSSDGLEIPAYLTVPVTKKAEKLPLVVLVHGGPKGPRDYWGYDPEVQFLANRGYAVLQPNFRASGGYGKKFLNAGDLQWGRLMQDDITYGVSYLVDKGIADPKKVVIMGGSYGGYATLAGLAFTPELYAAGVDIVGPSNLFTLLNSIPAYWEAGRAHLYEMTGDPNTEEGKKLLKNASPLFHVDKVNKPLLIVQGANDPRVKQAESDQIVVALRDKGKKVVYLLAKDEGHGFAKPLNRMAMYAEIEKFLAEVLGGVYQKDVPTEVQKTLDSLRVNVDSVQLNSKKQ